METRGGHGIIKYGRFKLKISHSNKGSKQPEKIHLENNIINYISSEFLLSLCLSEELSSP